MPRDNSLTVHTESLLALRSPWMYGREGPLRQAQALREICALAGNVSITPLRQHVPVHIWESGPAGHPVFRKTWRPTPGVARSDYNFLRLESTYTVDMDAFAAEFEADVPDRTMPDEGLRYLAADFAYEEHALLIGHLVVCANIALPGSVTLGEVIHVVNGRLRSADEGHISSVQPAVEEAKDVGWPSLGALPLQAVWDWFHQIPGMDRGRGKGSSARAVAALSHLLSKTHADSSAVHLAWALVGLEALYTQGNAAVSYQLREKAEVLLGRIRGHRKRLSQLYQFRSRFVHGDLDFPMAYTPFYDESDKSFEGEAYGAELLATAMLVATLQKMVKLGLHELAFTYTLRSSSASDRPASDGEGAAGRADA